MIASIVVYCMCFLTRYLLVVLPKKSGMSLPFMSMFLGRPGLSSSELYCCS